MDDHEVLKLELAEARAERDAMQHPREDELREMSRRVQAERHLLRKMLRKTKGGAE